VGVVPKKQRVALCKLGGRGFSGWTQNMPRKVGARGGQLAGNQKRGEGETQRKEEGLDGLKSIVWGVLKEVG